MKHAALLLVLTLATCAPLGTASVSVGSDGVKTSTAVGVTIS